MAVRSIPHDSAPLNGVQVDVGEKVVVFKRMPAADGASFAWVRAGQRDGYLRADYCV